MNYGIRETASCLPALARRVVHGAVNVIGPPAFYGIFIPLEGPANVALCMETTIHEVCDLGS